ncbi:MAG TPA: alpha/beta hydrolase family protein [Chryseolinea sp.]|nr:alpha/beta hydrolase family protein [Chryseolinea sp.]
MKGKLNIVLGCCLYLIFQTSFSQPHATPKRVDLSVKQGKENLNVFHDWIRNNNPGSQLINHLFEQASHFYDVRDTEIAKLREKKDWIERQTLVKRKLQQIVGPFPQKTPLNAIITGTVKKNGYRIEKIIFESMPEFYVTGCLFIPDRLKGKAPAVLNLIGHEQESFRAELDQVIILNLVKKGIVVLTIDPPGQGEHVQYFDPKVKLSSIGYSVIEHCYFGNQCFLSGSSAARYFIWDGIRAIDYLTSRKEVDAARIGVTGFSGGGTVTSYLGAFDDRVKVAIPSSWSTASRRQLETKGAQDAEAEFLRGLSNGITFEDLIEARAPKPTMMTFTSQDEYLTLQGAREAYSEIQSAYSAFDKLENLVLVEDDFKHWLTPKIRIAIYSFFMKHLGVAGDPVEEEIELLNAEELKVTSTGQISTSLGGQLIFDVNSKETERLFDKVLVSRKDIDNHLVNTLSKAKEISGYIEPTLNTTKEAFINGRYQRDGYTVGLFAIDGEGEYAIPFLLFIPDKRPDKSPAIIYLHPEGKITDAGPGGEIEKHVRQGYIVAAIDPLGIGETKNRATRGLADGYTGVMIGRSIVGIQAGDIARVAKYLGRIKDVDKERIGAIGKNGMCLPLIHAAAFEPLISNVILIGSLISYRSVAMNRFYRVGVTENEGGGLWHPYEIDFSWGVGGVLTAYDLPDLIACIAPRKVAMSGPKDQMLEPAPNELIDKEMEFPKAAYASKNVSSNLRVSSSQVDLDTTIKWCFNTEQ